MEKLQIDVNLSALPCNDNNLTEVSLQLHGDLITVTHHESNKRVGLLDRVTSCVLEQLFRTYTIEFYAFVYTSVASAKGSHKNIVNNKLSVILYGCKGNTEAVGSLLAASKLYLQHPFQYDQSKTYSNPHFLTRPGWQVQVPINMIDSANTESHDHVSVLHEVDRERVLQIFECAQGPETVFTPQVSGELKTELES